MVILSDFTFHFFWGDFKVNGCRENFSGGNKECFTNGEVECQCGGSLFYFGKALFPRTGRCPEECGDLGWNAAGTVHRKRWQRKALLFGDIQLDCHIARCLFEREATFMQIFFEMITGI